MEELFGFVVAGLALTGSPGPNTLSLAATGAAFGGRRGLVYLLGLTFGMIGVMTITASGVAGLLLALPGAASAVAIAAAGYFLYLAFRIATAPPLGADVGDRREPRFLAGVFLSLVNPKAYAAMAAMFSGFQLVAGPLALDALVKGTALLAILASVNVAWLYGGAALTRFFRSPRSNRAINVTFAVLLLVSVAFALRP